MNPKGVFALVLGGMLLLALLVAAPAPQNAQTELPQFVRSVYGPIRIIVKPNIVHDGNSIYGMWFPDIRTIFIRDSLPAWFARYGVLEHELCHVALNDANILIPEPLEEAICNAIAQQRSIEAQR